MSLAEQHRRSRPGAAGADAGGCWICGRSATCTSFDREFETYARQAEARRAAEVPRLRRRAARPARLLWAARFDEAVAHSEVVLDARRAGRRPRRLHERRHPGLPRPPRPGPARRDRAAGARLDRAGADHSRDALPAGAALRRPRARGGRAPRIRDPGRRRLRRAAAPQRPASAAALSRRGRRGARRYASRRDPVSQPAAVRRPQHGPRPERHLRAGVARARSARVPRSTSGTTPIAISSNAIDEATRAQGPAWLAAIQCDYGTVLRARGETAARRRPAARRARRGRSPRSRPRQRPPRGGRAHRDSPTRGRERGGGRRRRERARRRVAKPRRRRGPRAALPA